jgi:hypothetical protein
MSATPTAITPPRAATHPVLVARDVLITSAWALVGAVRASRLLAGDVDPIEVANAALEQMGFSHRLQPLH